MPCRVVATGRYRCVPLEPTVTAALDKQDLLHYILNPPRLYVSLHLA